MEAEYDDFKLNDELEVGDKKSKKVVFIAAAVGSFGERACY
jgi:hypothetical protein